MQIKKILTRSSDILILLAAFLFTNSTALSIFPAFPNLTDINGYAWTTVKACLIVILVLFAQLNLLSSWPAFLAAWKKQLPLAIFLFYCLCSIAWSVYRGASLYELSMAIFASLIGVYLAIRYDQSAGLKIIRGIAIFCVFASFALLFTVPSLARLDNPTFLGAWRGIFWHRNHMGSLMAFFSAVFLLTAFLSLSQKKQFFIDALCFILAAILVFGSRSATGILIFFALNALLVLAFVWLLIRPRLTRQHYLFLMIPIGVLAVLLLVNINFIFGLFGRDSSLTGRVPLWGVLLSHVWMERPFFGHGFGALWNQESFRIALTTRVGWFYQVFFSDNAFIDFLLSVGAVGLFIFLVYFVRAGIQSLKSFLKAPSLLSLFPLLIISYVLMANISYSFLLEVDQFVWMLLVMASVWAATEVAEFSNSRPVEPADPNHKTIQAEQN